MVGMELPGAKSLVTERSKLASPKHIGLFPMSAAAFLSPAPQRREYWRAGVVIEPTGAGLWLAISSCGFDLPSLWQSLVEQPLLTAAIDHGLLLIYSCGARI